MKLTNVLALAVVALSSVSAVLAAEKTEVKASDAAVEVVATSDEKVEEKK